MIIRSTRLGEIEIPNEAIIEFANGLPGFPDEKSFALLPYQPDSPFFFLQSTIEPNLTFLIVEPFGFFKEYTFELDDQAASELVLTQDNPPYIINIVTIPDKLENMTANLLAPIIINRRERTGRQIVLEKTPYTTRERLFKGGK